MNRRGVCLPLNRLVAILVGLANLAIFASHVPAADPKPDALIVATWNLEWFYDENTGDNYSQLAKQQSAPNRDDWNWKRDHVAKVIAAIRPTVIALQEVENRQVLYYLTRSLERNHNLKYRIAFITGSDHYTEQDVAILYQDGLTGFSRREQSREMYESRNFNHVSKHLFARFRWGGEAKAISITFLTAHLRARSEATETRRKQARLLRRWINECQRAGEHVVVLGDFNAEQTYGQVTPEGTIGILQGLSSPTTKDDLVDAHQHLSPHQRQTHINPGKEFDRILYTPELLNTDAGLSLRRVTRRRDLVVQGQADSNHFDDFYGIAARERDISDHYPLVIHFDVR